MQKAMAFVRATGTKESVIEKEPGIYQGTIAGWRFLFERDAGIATKESEELRKLRRETWDAQMESGILNERRDYRVMLARLNGIQSMSRKGNFWG